MLTCFPCKFSLRSFSKASMQSSPLIITQKIALLTSVFILCALASCSSFWASSDSFSIVLATSSTLLIRGAISPDNHHWPFLLGSRSLLHFNPLIKISSTLSCEQTSYLTQIRILEYTCTTKHATGKRNLMLIRPLEHGFNNFNVSEGKKNTHFMLSWPSQTSLNNLNFTEKLDVSQTSFKPFKPFEFHREIRLWTLAGVS